MVKKNLNFEFIEDFVDYILDRVEADEDLAVSVIAKYENAKDIIKATMLMEDIDFETINISDPVVNGYEDEYVFDLFVDSDGAYFSGVEPAKRNGKYLDLSNDEVYIFENCNAKVTDQCDKYSDTYIVHIGVEDEFEDEANEECFCPECKPKRDLSKADKTDRVEYRVNGESVSKDKYDKAYKDFYEEYENKYKDILKRHCEFMDEVNDMLVHFHI